MKAFNLKEYLKDPSKEVITRDGRAAKIHCINYCSSNFPIVAEIEGRNFSEIFTIYGRYEGDNRESPNDLFFASGKHCEGWVNIFKGASNDNNYVEYARIFKSKEDAEEAIEGDSDYITTLKIEWEE